MSTDANAVIDHLGGTYAVAKMIEAPPTTVHSWRKNGIPRSRMAHLRLAAKDAGIDLPAGLGGHHHGSNDEAKCSPRSTRQTNDLSGQQEQAA